MKSDKPEEQEERSVDEEPDLTDNKEEQRSDDKTRSDWRWRTEEQSSEIIEEEPRRTRFDWRWRTEEQSNEE